jgi:serine/threonine protein kinase
VADADARALCGTLIAECYLVEEQIGSGGFAWVFRGATPMKRRVAVKVLHSTDRIAFSRFQREVKVLKSLPRNPHVVEYIDDGQTADGRPFLVMSYVEGKTLAHEMDRWNRLEPRAAAKLLSELCEAFVELHHLGVVHRDVKPENIILTARGGITLIDLGLVRDAQGILKLLEQDEQLERRIFQDEIDRWTIAGTPEYMAPEQFSDGITADAASVQTDTWSDVFSLGVILHELLAGAVPFPLKTSTETIEPRKAVLQYMLRRMRITDGEVPACQGIDPALDSIRRKALRSNPRQRQPDAQALRGELMRYLETGRGVRLAYDTFTQAVTPGYVEELEAERLKMQTAIKAMETALGDAGARQDFEEEDTVARAALDDEPDDEEDADTLAQVGRDSEPEAVDQDTVTKPFARTAPAEKAGAAGARAEPAERRQPEPGAEDAFVIIDLPPPKSRAAGATPKPPPPVDEKKDDAEEAEAGEPAGASLFRRTFVFDEDDLSLLGVTPPVEGEAEPRAKPARTKAKKK